jgi:hypothetical protein
MTRRRFAPLLCALPARTPSQPPDSEPPGRYPDGRSRTEELLKADYTSNLKDLDEIKTIAEDVKAELERNTRHVLSLGNLKKLEQIEKLSQRIRGRMRRY